MVNCMKFFSLTIIFLLIIYAWITFLWHFYYVVNNWNPFIIDTINSIYLGLGLYLLWSLFQTSFAKIREPPDQFRLKMEECEKYESLLVNDNKSEAVNYLKEIIDQRGLQILMVNESGFPRYCLICRLIKPDNSHHCSSCKVCVLNMDHHCFWLSSCIGHHNIKAFVLLLFYLLLMGFYGAALTAPFAFLFLKSTTPLNTINYELLNVLILCMISTGFGLTALFMLPLYVYNIITNQTTIYHMEAPRYRADVDISEFKLTKWQYFQNIFGDNLFFWFLPFHTSLTNGYDWPTRKQNIEKYEPLE